MDSIALLPVFVIGLLGGVHCVGMCGGIVSAFSIATPGRRPFPVAVTAAAANSPARPANFLAAAADSGTRVLAFNTGRIASYGIAGALAGLLGSVPALINLAVVQTAAYWLANAMLVALGLTLMNAWHGLARVEQVGQMIWRHVQPAIRRLLPVQHAWQALALGGLWGWVPCGMVYSVLMTAILFSLGGFINAVYAKTFDDVSIVPTFILTPLTYLGGVFYSMDLLSPFWQSVSYLNPIVYMVNAFRYGVLGHSDVSVTVSLTFITVLVVVLYVVALRLLQRGTGMRE